MNQLCKVCGEPAAGFHFGAFTCEGCKSFFGRTYNNISAIAGCKNNGDCVINKKNRTACKACRLRKCLLVGMSKSGSRYGRRSNWFKIHCLLQEQQNQQQQQQQLLQQPQQSTGASEAGGGRGGGGGGNIIEAPLSAQSNNNNYNNFEQLARLHQLQVRQTYQDKTNPCIKTAAAAAAAAAAASAAVATSSTSNAVTNPSSSTPTFTSASTSTKSFASATTAALSTTSPSTLTSVQSFLTAAKFLNGIGHHTPASSIGVKLEARLSDSPSDSGASSATGDDANDECVLRYCSSGGSGSGSVHHHYDAYDTDVSVIADMERERRREEFLQIFRSHSEPLRIPFAPYVAITSPLPPPAAPLTTATAASAAVAAATLLKQEFKWLREETATSGGQEAQDEPIDLTMKTTNPSRFSRSHTTPWTVVVKKEAPISPQKAPSQREQIVPNFVLPKTNPLDLSQSQQQSQQQKQLKHEKVQEQKQGRGNKKHGEQIEQKEERQSRHEEITLKGE